MFSVRFRVITIFMVRVKIIVNGRISFMVNIKMKAKVTVSKLL